jgi:hypothetical protein
MAAFFVALLWPILAAKDLLGISSRSRGAKERTTDVHGGANVY